MKKGLALFVLCIFMATILSGCTKTYTEEEMSAKDAELEAVKNTYDEKISSVQSNLEKLTEQSKAQTEALNTKVSELSAELTSKTKEINEKDAIIQQKNTEISTKDSKITELENKPAVATQEKIVEKIVEVPVEKTKLGIIDSLKIGEIINNKQISDKDVPKMFDGEVEFDNKEYDAEEILALNGLKVSNDVNDADGNLYVTVPIDGITYLYLLEDKLDTSAISEDETLKIKLLGNPVEINKWDNDAVTFITGDTYTLELGTETTIDGKVIKITKVGDEQAVISVDGAVKNIEEEKEYTVGGITFRIDGIYSYNAPVESGIVVIVVGDEVEKEIEDGDEYEDDSIWEWAITDHSIGLKLVEEFTDIGDDELHPALGTNEKISLPNNYLNVEFLGKYDYDTKEITFKKVTKHGNEYVEVRGDLTAGREDYSKVYVDKNGIYDTDLEEITDTVEIDDTESTVQISGDYIIVQDIAVNIGFADVFMDSEQMCGQEDDFISSYGVVLKDPEDACDDEKVTIVVPEERVEAGVTVA